MKIKMKMKNGSQRFDIIGSHRLFFFSSDSLQARLNSHYEAWTYKKNKHKKIRARRKSV